MNTGCTNQYWIWIRFAVAIILLVAAILKAYQLATAPSLGEGILHARWFNIFVVEFELFFGIWLIFGLLPKLTWFVTTILFSTFGMISFYKAISGETSCGCFGSVMVNPWITTIFDLGVVGVLLKFRAKQMDEQNLKRLLFSICNIVVSWLMIALPLGWLMVSFQPSAVTSDGEIVGTSNVIMLNPKEWLGQRLPLLDFVDSSENLNQGMWIVILYGAECQKCKEHFAEWKNKGFPVAKNGDERIVMLEISGITVNEFQQELKDEPYRWSGLSRSKQWYVETPVVIYLDEGIVKQVWTEK